MPALTIYKDVSAGILSAGIEYYLPLFFDETATLFGYLPAGAQLVLVGDLAASIQHFNAEARKRYAFLAYPPERRCPNLGAYFYRKKGFLRRPKRSRGLCFRLPLPLYEASPGTCSKTVTSGRQAEED